MFHAEIQDGRQKWWQTDFCKKYILDTLGVENFDEIALSRTVKEIEANLCFYIFGKNSKIQNGHHFWGEENFLKIVKSTLLRYLVGRKFRQNLSISDIKKFENSKWPPFLKRVKCFEIEVVVKKKSSLLRYPVGRKFRRNRSISHS